MEKEEEKKRRVNPKPKSTFDDVPEELLHRIQSLLEVEEAARTCVLSKKWFHAWSTIPTLRFRPPFYAFYKQRDTIYNNYINLIDRTLLKYVQDNIPIESLKLCFGILKEEWDSLVEKWIRSVASKSSLKELYLTIWFQIPSFYLPEEIFSGGNLNKIKICAGWTDQSLYMSSINPVIKCVSLRVLKLEHVDISEEALDNLISTCTLLEKIKLVFRHCLKIVKIKNLRCLHELKITSEREINVLEIDDVPSLDLFFYKQSRVHWSKPLLRNADSLGTVRKLLFDDLIIDNGFFDMIKSKFPLLEILTIERGACRLERSLDITSVSLKRFTLQLWDERQIDIQVYAPNLIHFCYKSHAMPSLLFPNINTPKQIELKLVLKRPMDLSFFLKMREALNISCKFDIDIVHAMHYTPVVTLNFDVDDLRRRVSFPATNVQRLSLESFSKISVDLLPFFNAFFLICHPNYVKVYQKTSFKDKSFFCKLLISGMMELKTTNGSHLKAVEILNPGNAKWKTLTNSWGSFLEETESAIEKSKSLEFKLNWSSQ